MKAISSHRAEKIIKIKAMDKRELIRKWFSILDKTHKNNVEIELSQKHNVTTMTVRCTWIYSGKLSDSLLDEVLETLQRHCEKQETEYFKRKQSLIDAI
ncbi:hypothetical protein [Chryseobacterium sp. 7]|uniref:hypothetical protein n=1 Tax=Chryseobacterium sp. 7 TaxID=2035214 RepID=UPI000EAF75C2|nr:hypothetical protein [Chryseobacterium sp. 7]